MRTASTLAIMESKPASQSCRSFPYHVTSCPLEILKPRSCSPGLFFYVLDARKTCHVPLYEISRKFNNSILYAGFNIYGISLALIRSIVSQNQAKCLECVWKLVSSQDEILTRFHYKICFISYTGSYGCQFGARNHSVLVIF